jgi:hypothetical protein
MRAACGAPARTPLVLQVVVSSDAPGNGIRKVQLAALKADKVCCARTPSSEFPATQSGPEVPQRVT